MGMDVCSSQALFSPDLHIEDAGMAPQDNPGQAGELNISLGTVYAVAPVDLTTKGSSCLAAGG